LLTPSGLKPPAWYWSHCCPFRLYGDGNRRSINVYTICLSLWNHHCQPPDRTSSHLVHLFMRTQTILSGYMIEGKLGVAKIRVTLSVAYLVCRSGTLRAAERQGTPVWVLEE
jgi:hypothetical protein